MKINGLARKISGDADYITGSGTTYDPDTVSVLSALCDPNSHVLDIGANIGLTALAFSSLCPNGTVVAIEPGRKAFHYLEENVRANSVSNVRAFNFAAGAENGFVQLYVDDSNLATAFVIGNSTSNGASDTSVPMYRIDDAFPDFAIDRVDVIKIDVEGYELEALGGAGETLRKFSPLVYMEMNHWCLNVFRRIALPDFYDEIFSLFPVIYAIDGTFYLDFRVPANRDRIFHEHIVLQKWSNLVCGFDQQSVETRLATLNLARSHFTAPTQTMVADDERIILENADLRSECQALRQDLETATRQVDGYRNSTIWRMTAPLRSIANAWRGSGRALK